MKNEIILLSALLLGSCASTNETVGENTSDAMSQSVEDQVASIERAEAEAKAAYAQEKESLVGNSSFRTVSNNVGSSMGLGMGEDAPSNAQAGQCFTKVMTPAVYKYDTEKVMVQPEMTSYKTIPAKYNWATKTVTVSEESKRLVPVPATYKTVAKKIKVSDEATTLVSTPPKYGFVSEKVLVAPATEMWKRGEGTQVNENGILCKVKVPAKYRTVKKKVLVSEGTTVEKVIPAKYQVVKQRVVATPATFNEVIIPAKTKVIKVKEIVEPARKVAFSTPAKFKTIKKQILVEAPQTKWAPILCNTNATRENIAQVQKALKVSGYNPGSLDGRLGKGTATAIKNFQKKNNLAQGGLTLETLKALNVNL